MKHVVSIVFIAFFLLTGCAAWLDTASEQTQPDDRYMKKLEQEVNELCYTLTKDIVPGSIHISWKDSRHRHSPMLSEAYAVSMFKRRLATRGYTVTTQENTSDFKLTLIMTPDKKKILTRAVIKKDDDVIATCKAYFTKGSDDWNKALYSDGNRTKTRIPIGRTP